jgi:hypothetical protein
MATLTVDLGEFFPLASESILDQLTQVRTYVRNQFGLHEDAEKLSVTVVFQNGDIEELVFDKWVGYPDGTDEKFWLNKWLMECKL